MTRVIYTLSEREREREDNASDFRRKRDDW